MPDSQARQSKIGHVPQFMEGDPLDNAERLLDGLMHDRGRYPGALSRGEAADLEVALAEVRRARVVRDHLARAVDD